MKIQLISDIHLEFGDFDLPDTEADLIVAAGDIGLGCQGIDWLNRQDKPVIYIAGNHEFYGLDYHETLSNIRAKSEKTNVTFLENETVVIDGVRFLGCSLWTDLGGSENDHFNRLVKSVNDFRKISFGDRDFNHEDFMELHQNSRDWLASTLAEPFEGKTVVVTHHAPTYWSWQERFDDPMLHAYCNDLKALLHKHDVAYWFHGHTHYVQDYLCADTRVICNPRGYKKKARLTKRFDPLNLLSI